MASKFGSMAGGIDALLGKQTRPHKDLDIAVNHKDESKLRSVLTSLGYNNKKKQENTTDWNFVLSNKDGKEIDVHVFAFDADGKNVYGIAYPKESLTGRGIINNQSVNCIAPERVVKFHESFKPSKKHIKDIKALCKKFNLELPENYKNL